MISENIISKVISEINADELIALTSDLVKINSVWDPVTGTSEQENQLGLGSGDWNQRAGGSGFCCPVG
jgi:hypothetical protein